ncbi:MAG: response regulator [Anaerolineae bacterium]|nr:response regulator [Anaerolineae bacterium]
MNTSYNGTAVPRHFVFVTSKGDFVVQLRSDQGEDLLTGRVIRLEENVFGHAITDGELDQLKTSGRVEHYNRSFVWVLGLPEPHRYDPNIHDPDSLANVVRAYYVDTPLPESELSRFRNWIAKAQLGQSPVVDVRAGRLILKDADGSYFVDFTEADSVCQTIRELAGEALADAEVAFTEIHAEENTLVHDISIGQEQPDLRTIIASQTDTSLTAGKQVVLLVSRDDERQAIEHLCHDLHMRVAIADSGVDLVALLEEGVPDLLITEMRLPDMHGWELLSKLRELPGARHLPIMVIADHQMAGQQSLALGVAKVDVYLVRPLSLARLRQNIWLALKGR